MAAPRNEYGYPNRIFYYFSKFETIAWLALAGALLEKGMLSDRTVEKFGYALPGFVFLQRFVLYRAENFAAKPREALEARDRQRQHQHSLYLFPSRQAVRSQHEELAYLSVGLIALIEYLGENVLQGRFIQNPLLRAFFPMFAMMLVGTFAMLIQEVMNHYSQDHGPRVEVVPAGPR